MTSVHQASLSGNTRLLQMLLEQGAFANVQDNHGYRPIHFACAHGRLETMHVLVRWGASINGPPSMDGNLPIHLACQGGHLDVVKWLILNNGDVNYTNVEGRTAFDLACEYGQRSVVELLLNSTLVQTQLRTSSTVKQQRQPGELLEQTSCLHLAARNGHIDVLRLLLHEDYGVNINRVTQSGSCLHEACAAGHFNTVMFLLENQINISLRNCYGETALEMLNTLEPTQSRRAVQQLLYELLNSVPARAVRDFCNLADPSTIAFREGDHITVLDQYPRLSVNKSNTGIALWKGFKTSAGVSRTGFFPGDVVVLQTKHPTATDNLHYQHSKCIIDSHRPVLNNLCNTKPMTHDAQCSVGCGILTDDENDDDLSQNDLLHGHKQLDHRHYDPTATSPTDSGMEAGSMGTISLASSSAGSHGNADAISADIISTTITCEEDKVSKDEGKMAGNIGDEVDTVLRLPQFDWGNATAGLLTSGNGNNRNSSTSVDSGRSSSYMACSETERVASNCHTVHVFNQHSSANINNSATRRNFTESNSLQSNNHIHPQCYGGLTNNNNNCKPVACCTSSTATAFYPSLQHDEHSSQFHDGSSITTNSNGSGDSNWPVSSSIFPSSASIDQFDLRWSRHGHFDDLKYSTAVIGRQILQQQQDSVFSWLTSIDFGRYFSLFCEAGYDDLGTITRMTPEDLNAVGITHPTHRKRLKWELAKLSVPNSIPDFIPKTVEDWLSHLGMQQYLSILQSQGYVSIENVMQITWEDLEDIGVRKLGHQKKLILAIERLKRLQKTPQTTLPFFGRGKHYQSEVLTCTSSNNNETRNRIGEVESNLSGDIVSNVNNDFNNNADYDFNGIVTDTSSSILTPSPPPPALETCDLQSLGKILDLTRPTSLLSPCITKPTNSRHHQSPLAMKTTQNFYNSNNISDCIKKPANAQTAVLISEQQQLADNFYFCGNALTDRRLSTPPPLPKRVNSVKTINSKMNACKQPLVIASMSHQQSCQTEDILSTIASPVKEQKDRKHCYVNMQNFKTPDEDDVTIFKTDNSQNLHKIVNLCTTGTNTELDNNIERNDLSHSSSSDSTSTTGASFSSSSESPKSPEISTTKICCKDDSPQCSDNSSTLHQKQGPSLSVPSSISDATTVSKDSRHCRSTSAAPALSSHDKIDTTLSVSFSSASSGSTEITNYSADMTNVRSRSSSTVSMESIVSNSTLPFANEDVGTIRQRSGNSNNMGLYRTRHDSDMTADFMNVNFLDDLTTCSLEPCSTVGRRRRSRRGKIDACDKSTSPILFYNPSNGVSSS